MRKALTEGSKILIGFKTMTLTAKQTVMGEKYAGTVKI